MTPNVTPKTRCSARNFLLGLSHYAYVWRRVAFVVVVVPALGLLLSELTGAMWPTFDVALHAHTFWSRYFYALSNGLILLAAAFMVPILRDGARAVCAAGAKRQAAGSADQGNSPH